MTETGNQPSVVQLPRSHGRRTQWHLVDAENETDTRVRFRLRLRALLCIELALENRIETLPAPAVRIRHENDEHKLHD